MFCLYPSLDTLSYLKMQPPQLSAAPTATTTRMGIFRTLRVCWFFDELPTLTVSCSSF
jgi:hypothetical protein